MNHANFEGHHLLALVQCQPCWAGCAGAEQCEEVMAFSAYQNGDPFLCAHVPTYAAPLASLTYLYSAGNHLFDRRRTERLVPQCPPW